MLRARNAREPGLLEEHAQRCPRPTALHSIGMRHFGASGEGGRAPGARHRLSSGLWAAPLLALLSSAPARAEASASCGSVAFNASVAGQRGLIGGTLCVPSGARTVQLLLH